MNALTVFTENLEYLADLDYIDLTNIFKVNTAYRNLSKAQRNNILRQILLMTPKTIEIVQGFDILKALDELYGKIDDLIGEHYNRNITRERLDKQTDEYIIIVEKKQLPDWVDQEKFINYIKRRIVTSIAADIESYFETIDENNEYGEVGPLSKVLFPKKKKKDLTYEVTINKYMLAIPFMGSDDIDMYSQQYKFDDKIFTDVHNKIILSEHFINYIKPALLQYQSKYVDDVVKKLLFVKEYVNVYL